MYYIHRCNVSLLITAVIGLIKHLWLSKFFSRVILQIHRNLFSSLNSFLLHTLFVSFSAIEVLMWLEWFPDINAFKKKFSVWKQPFIFEQISINWKIQLNNWIIRIVNFMGLSTTISNHWAAMFMRPIQTVSE